MKKPLLYDRDLADLERHLREHARRDRPTDGARRETLAKVTVAAGAGLAATTATSGAAAVASGLPLWFGVKCLAAGATSAALVLGVVNEAHRGSVAARSPVMSSRASSSVSASTTSTKEAHASMDPVNTVESLVAPPISFGTQLPKASHTARAGTPGRRSPPRPTDVPKDGSDVPPLNDVHESETLKKELGILGQARAARHQHDPARALAELDGYAQDFPGGSLAIEAGALRVETLFDLGQRQAGQSLAETFLANYPRSPAAMRVRMLLAASRASKP